MANADTAFAVPDLYADTLLGGESFFDPARDEQQKKVRNRRFQKKWGNEEGLAELYDAYRLQEETGLGSESALMRRLRKAGLIDAEGNVIAPEGYDPSSFDPTSDEAFDPSSRNRLKGALRGGDFRGSLYRKNFEEMRAELAKKKMDQFKAERIDPLTKSVSEQLQEMLSNPVISPEELADMRAQMVSQARTQETNRLKRVGASLGLRGLDPGSIAGAALVNRVAEDTDRRISEGMRQFNFDVQELERTSQQQELGLSTALATQMSQLEAALTQGNLEQVFAISNDIGSIQEAIASQNAALRAQRDASRLGFYGSAVSGVAQGAGTWAGGAAQG